MNVSVSSEFRFYKTPDGAVWTDGLSVYGYLARFLTRFDRVNVVARVTPVPKPLPNFRRADGPDVSFSPLPYYLGPRQYLLRAGGISRAARAAIGNSDAVMLVVPGQVAGSIRATLPAGRPYGVHVIGDPQDVFAPGAVRHPLRPLLRWWCPRELRRLCRTACGAMYENKTSLPTRYPCPAHMVSVADVELPPEAFVAQPRHVPRGSQPFTLLNVGTMTQLYKGQDVLIDAVAECLREGMNLRLVLVGDGKHRPEFESRARRLGIHNRVEFHGQLPVGDAVRAELDAADLFAFPSRAEGMGRVLVEAIARGLPCLASRVGGIPELLAAEDLLPIDDKTAWINAIRRVVGDAQQQAAMSARNLQKAREYSAEILGRQRTEFYDHVAERTAEWLKAGAQSRARRAAELLSRALVASEVRQ